MQKDKYINPGKMHRGKPPTGRLKKRPRTNGAGGPPIIESISEGATIWDFWGFIAEHTYIYLPTGRRWPKSAIDSIFPKVVLLGANGKPLLDDDGKEQTQAASRWLDIHRRVEELTWIPGRETILEDTLQTENGLIMRAGCNTFNQYTPTTLKPGDAKKAGPWLDHCKKLFGDEAEHLIRWFAFKTQYPARKINHSLILAGGQGIGKDSIIEPLRRAVGASNFREISPVQLTEPFNDFLRAVVLRINEAHDLGEINRFSFYEHCKIFSAAPPDTLRINCKYMPAFYIPNCVGAILTTNHRTMGIYLPPDDRRHYVLWSDLTKESFDQKYWDRLWSFYDQQDGDRHVFAYLLELDVSEFNPVAAPPKTAAFYAIVESNSVSEDAELADTLDACGKADPNNPHQKIWPDVVTVNMIKEHANERFRNWLEDRRNSRSINHRFDRCGYELVRATSNEGRWIIDRVRQAVYALKTLSKNDQYNAAERLTDAFQRTNKAPGQTSAADGELPF